MERLRYGTEYHDDYDNDYDNSGRVQLQYQEKHEEAYEPAFDLDPDSEHLQYEEKHKQAYEPEFDLDPDSEHWEDDHRAGTQDAVDHQVDFALDAESKAERMAAHFKWRYDSRAAAKGETWDPPDTREFKAPFFVRVADMQQRQDDVPR